MKLKNSFLIVAGVFFFAVAFINFAKAGDDGGTVPEQTLSNTKPHVEDCISVLYMEFGIGGPYYHIVDSEYPPHNNWTEQATAHGERTVCVSEENSTCTPVLCSGAEKLIFW